jgi:hypothetical protein
MHAIELDRPAHECRIALTDRRAAIQSGFLRAVSGRWRSIFSLILSCALPLLARGLVIILSLTGIVIGLTGDARGDADCVYEDRLRMLFTPPDRRLGDYRLELAPPDFRDRVSVQEHYKYSIIFGYLLNGVLSSASRGLCDAEINSAYFPDLYINLTRKSNSGNLESDRSNCLLALLVATRLVRPDDVAFKDAALRALRTTSHWLAPTNVTLEAAADLFDSLAYIYDANTVMNAFTSVKASDLSSVEIHSFRRWLSRQNTERREALIPLRTCVDRAGSQTPAVSTRRLRLQSSVVPPGAIKVTADRSNIVTRRPLRRLIVVGVSDGLVAENTFKACEDRTVMIPSARSSRADGAVAVQIGCTQASPALMDRWIALYCDPNDCRSDVEEEAALKEVAHSSELLTALSARSDGAPAMGPYLIEIEAQPK